MESRKAQIARVANEIKELFGAGPSLAEQIEALLMKELYVMAPGAESREDQIAEVSAKIETRFGAGPTLAEQIKELLMKEFFVTAPHSPETPAEEMEAPFIESREAHIERVVGKITKLFEAHIGWVPPEVVKGTKTLLMEEFGEPVIPPEADPGITAE